MTAWRIEGGRVLTEDGFLEAPLTVSQGVIAGESTPGSQTLDASGCLVLPGIVDIHGDAFERALLPRPGVDVPSEIAFQEVDRQLLASGITTAFHGLTFSFEPGLRDWRSSLATARAIRAIRGGLAVDHRLHLRFEVRAAAAEADTIRLLEEGTCDLLAFNDHFEDSKDQLATGSKRLQRSLERTGLDAEAFAAMLQTADQPKAEREERIARLTAIARAHDIAVASHDPANADDIAAARALGITIAEFPMTRGAAEAAKREAMATVFGAPNVMRGGSHKGLVGAAQMAADDLCDVLVSDYHYPSLLNAPFRLAEELGQPIEAVWPMVSEHPARIMGMTDRGTLHTGQRGDVIVLRAPEGGRLAELKAVFAASGAAFLLPG